MMAKKTDQINLRRRPQLNIKIERLFLDKDNPRLPENVQGQNEVELLKALYKGFNLDELIDSMRQNGYFDEEPLVVIPRNVPSKLSKANVSSEEFIKFISSDTTTFTVVEGNRRVAAAKLLIDPKLRSQLNIKQWQEILPAIIDDLKLLPAIVYSERSDVTPYMGVRHIVGIQKWDSYAKARYIARLIDQEKKTLPEVETQIGDSQGSVRKNYISYKILQQARDEFDYNTKSAEDKFSLLILAVGQGPIKRFLGLPTKLKDTNPNAPVPKDKIKSLKNLTSWVFGDERNSPVIEESRGITDYLSNVVESPDALKHLERTRNLQEAYDLSDGEEQMVLRYLANINSKLQTVLGLAHLHKTADVISEVEKCAETVKQLLKTVKEN
jgi:hypothetical protein